MSVQSAPIPAVDRSVAGAHPLVPAVAGIALIAFPVLETAGAVTAPPKGDGPDAYLASLGADPALTWLSASLLHYSWVLFALGVLAAIGLVRGRRGRLLTSVVAVVTSFSAIQLSGLVLGDWYGAAIDRALPAGRATAVFDGATADPWSAVWLLSGQLVGFAGVLLVVVALARAGVLSWWLLALPVAGLVALIALGPVLGAVGFGIGTLIGGAPMAVVGLRLLQRGSARVRREELA